jgi:hypothetical protein
MPEDLPFWIKQRLKVMSDAVESRHDGVAVASCKILLAWLDAHPGSPHHDFVAGQVGGAELALEAARLVDVPGRALDHPSRHGSARRVPSPPNDAGPRLNRQP